MAEKDDPPSLEAFDARLRKARGEGRAPEATGGAALVRTKFGAGLQVGIELVAGVACGALLGYGLDYWLGTLPLFLILFFMLGAGAGTLNAYRWMRRYAESAEGRDGG